MKTQVTGTVVDGTLKLDQRLDLPDYSRVQVTVERTTEWQDRWQKALTSLEQLIRERPLRSEGKHYSREELHERP